MRIAPPVVLKEDEKESLERWSRGRSLPARLVERSRTVLLAPIQEGSARSASLLVRAAPLTRGQAEAIAQGRRMAQNEGGELFIASCSSMGVMVGFVIVTASATIRSPRDNNH